MNKSILSAFGAFISFLCVIVLLTAFAKSEDGLFAILAVISAFSGLAFIGMGLDGKAAEYMSNFFAEEGGEDE